MKNVINIRCGKSVCENYNSRTISVCNIFKDRKECIKSMRQRKKQGNKSRRDIQNYVGW